MLFGYEWSNKAASKVSNGFVSLQLSEVANNQGASCGTAWDSLCQ